MSAHIRDEARRFVEDKAAGGHMSEADIVRRALEAICLIDELQSQDGGIVLQRKAGRLDRLVRL